MVQDIRPWHLVPFSQISLKCWSPAAHRKIEPTDNTFLYCLLICLPTTFPEIAVYPPIKSYFCVMHSQFKSCLSLNYNYWNGFLLGTGEPECLRHMLLDDDTRPVSYGFTTYKCDRDLAEGWYRFLSGRHLSTQCAESYKCNTNYPGWLTGGHPSVEQGRVSRQVCFGRKSGSSCPCWYSTYITVRNCGAFYVYKLKPTPTCSLRYCTN